jgi:hypothetical protein
MIKDVPRQEHQRKHCTHVRTLMTLKPNQNKPTTSTLTKADDPGAGTCVGRLSSEISSPPAFLLFLFLFVELLLDWGRGGGGPEAFEDELWELGFGNVASTHSKLFESLAGSAISQAVSGPVTSRNEYSKTVFT